MDMVQSCGAINPTDNLTSYQYCIYTIFDALWITATMIDLIPWRQELLIYQILIFVFVYAHILFDSHVYLLRGK